MYIYIYTDIYIGLAYRKPFNLTADLREIIGRERYMSVISRISPLCVGGQLNGL